MEPSRLKGQKDIVEYVKQVIEELSSRSSSLQIGHTSIEDGNFIIRNGDIIVSESDDTIVLRILHGQTPEIRMWPLGETDTHRAALFSHDFSIDGPPDQAVLLSIETTGATQDGGKLLLTRGYTVLSHQPNGGSESYFWLNADGVLPQIGLYQGKWPDRAQYNTDQGLYPGVFNVTAGFGSLTHTYNASFASTVAPVIGLVNTGGTVSWNITAMSTSAFTVTWTGTAAKTINIWNFRIT